MLTKEKFREIGLALYGADWTGPMAHEHDWNIRSVQRWASGQNSIPAGIVEMLAVTVAEHRRELGRLQRELWEALEW